MNPNDDLASTDIAPALPAQVRALVERQQSDLARRDALLAEKDFKITALTYELAYYRRIRFGKAGEALVGASCSRKRQAVRQRGQALQVAA